MDPDLMRYILSVLGQNRDQLKSLADESRKHWDLHLKASGVPAADFTSVYTKAYSRACSNLAAFERWAVAQVAERGSKTGHCHAIDEDCTWIHCPQLADGEPGKTGRQCPRMGK